MGYGDEIMVTGEAKKLFQANGKPCIIMGKNRKPRWHPMWQNNPKIIKYISGSIDGYPNIINNFSGNRPYVDYNRSNQERWFYTDWKCSRGEIYFSAQERNFGNLHRTRFIIEPNIKSRASPNKLWGFEKSQELVRLLPHLNWAQLGPEGTRWLIGVERIITSDFRHACAVINNSRAYVGPEGGLHHAAAACYTPAVVIFGGMTSPMNTGYDDHTNLSIDDGKNPCGWRIPCLHCKKAMDMITPEYVASKVKRYG
jgi:hypothetical protein